MADPFEDIIFRERAKNAAAIGLLLIVTVVAAALLFWPSTFVTRGRVVEATVVSAGTYAAGKARGGELPILTVRMPDGSTRQVKASWATAGKCRSGSRVPLIQRGTALQVVLSGCA